MKLKCTINEKEHDIVQGATFTDEFSEILDSGSILITHVSEMKDLKPFNDVYIYSDEKPFEGFNNRNIIKEDDMVKINKTPKYPFKTIRLKHNYINDSGYPVKIESIKTENNVNFKISGYIIEHLIKYIFELYTDEDDIKYIFYHKDNANDTSSRFYVNVSLFSNITNQTTSIDFYSSRLFDIDGNKMIVLRNDIDDVVIFLNVNFDEYYLFVFEYLNTTYKILDIKFNDENNKFSRVVSGKEYKKINYNSFDSDYNFYFQRWYDMELIISKNAFNSNENNCRIIYNVGNDYKELKNIIIQIDEDDNTKCYVYNKNFENVDTSNILSFETYDELNNWEYNNDITDGQYIFIGTEGSSDREIYIKQNGEIVFFDLYDNIFGKNILTLNGDYYTGVRTIVEKDVEGYVYNGLYYGGRKFYKDIISQDIDKRANYFLNQITQEKNETQLPTRKFYKHMLVDNFREECINLKQKVYNYTIQLCSETKYLERIILPNISITQPLKKSNKRSVWEYMNQFINLYSPKVKYVTNDEFNYYKEQPKYSLDPDLEELFGKTYAPDFSLNNPSLREVLSKLMVTKDCIPYVKDNVIYAMDISQTTGEFDMNPQYINYIEGSMSSQDYTNNLRTNYNGALSQENSAHLIEYLGFRNSNESLLTIENMRLETRFPIYKINKLYMCYYKNVDAINQNTKEISSLTFLCKQDITPLVKLNSERNILPSDWYNFTEEPPKNIKELAKYKLATIGYDIGSNQVSGWGTKYTYPSGFWDNTKTYIQNIFEFVDKVTPYGVMGNNLLKKHSLDKSNVLPTISYGLHSVAGPFSNLHEGSITLGNNNTPLAFKGFVFEIDYNAMYSGTTVHSKDNDFGDIVTVDNPASSLTILESDGVFEKEKINRLGNKTYKINARYTGTDDDYSLLQPVGSYYDDKIVYRREYSIYNNEIVCNYQSSSDYIMKSYYNSVYSKHRPFNLLSMGESTTRAENRKSMILFSKDKCYYETSNNLLFNNFDNVHEMIVSCIKKDKYFEFINDFDYSDKINAAVLVCNGPNYNDDGDVINYSIKSYLSDINAFTNGYSLCFNCKMYDNVSMGVYIDKAILQENHNNITTDDVTNDIIGSGQKWHMTVDNIETGFLQNIGIYFASIDTNSIYHNDASNIVDNEKLKEIYHDILFKLPYNYKINLDTLGHNIGNDFHICKDNKETLDFTFQLESISIDENVIITPWIMKLNDLLGNYNKFEQDKQVNDTLVFTDKYAFYTRTNDVRNLTGEYVIRVYPTVFISLNKINLESGEQLDEDVKVDEIIDKELLGLVINGQGGYYPTLLEDPLPEGDIVGFNFDLIVNKIISYSSSKIIAECDIKYVYSDFYETDTPITLEKKNVQIEFNQGLFEEKNVFYHTFNKWEWDSNNVLINAYVPGHLFNNEMFFYYIEVDNKLEYTATYPKNMFIYQRSEYLKKHLVQEELNQDDIEEYEEEYGLKQVNESVENIFSVKIDEQNRPHIYIELNNANLDKTKQTIEYWYYDTDYPTYSDDSLGKMPYHNGSDSYHLVFAVNVTEEDWARGYIKIYLSLLENSNLKVYDNQNNLIGYSLNYAEEGVTDKIDGKQRFKPVE